MIAHEPNDAPLRVVLDTNVLLSLWVFADSRFAPLRALVDRGEWVAFTNDECLAEFERVLDYEQFRLSAERQMKIFAEYVSIAAAHNQGKAFSVPLPRCSDRDDQKFLELARSAEAQLLVTADKALLKMARRNKLAGLFHIVTPDALLAQVLQAKAA